MIDFALNLCSNTWSYLLFSWHIVIAMIALCCWGGFPEKVVGFGTLGTIGTAVVGATWMGIS